MDHQVDATRRALMAALAGGLAMAAPVAAGAKGKNKNKGGKPKPPLAGIMAHTVNMFPASQAGAAVFAVELEVVVVQAGGNGRVETVNTTVALGTPQQMRASIVRAVQEAAADFIGDVPADRVAVLLI